MEGGGAKEEDGFGGTEVKEGSGKGESDLLRLDGGRLCGGVRELSCIGREMGSESA